MRHNLLKRAALAVLAFYSGLTLSSAAIAGSYGLVQIRQPTSLATYHYASGAVTLASSATDFLTIYGSSSKTVRIIEIRLRLTETGTSPTFNEVYLLRRSTAPSGGTATTLSAVSADTNNASATGTVKAWTANPTVGTLVGNISVAKFASICLGAGTYTVYMTNPPEWVVYRAPSLAQALTVRGTGEGIALNLNGQTQGGTSPKAYVDITTVEE